MCVCAYVHTGERERERESLSSDTQHPVVLGKVKPTFCFGIKLIGQQCLE